MKAALLKAFGEPLALEEVREPVPGAGQILLQVNACGVCHSDLHIARGEWERFKNLMSLPVILGHEVAGRVVAVGPEVEELREGDAVGVAWFCYTCGRCPYCRRDLEVFCENSEITGVTVNGGFGEYMLAWASHAVRIPRELSLAQAAPLFCAGGTVYSALRKVKLDNSSHLAVWGTGGLGQFAVQLGKLAGSRVTAVDTVDAKLALAREFGADDVVPAGEAETWFEDFERQADVALVCANSAQAYHGAFRSLRKTGVLLVVGLPSDPLTWTAADFVRSGVRIVPSRVVTRQELRELLSLAARSTLRSRVERLPLEEINNALERLHEGKIAGRAVIDFAV
ncbi:alcohol dehydrogenase catalytic domain-containing protein [Acidobacteria bacterium AH-259-L09]|nr:alcohol dehydrogenase catalytic domain-containing protein [Acidobacteria bacterium AH-259-L09]